MKKLLVAGVIAFGGGLICTSAHAWEKAITDTTGYVVQSAGNAAFTVGGVTKGVQGLWSLGATPMLTRFDVVSDAHGEITGSFAAADANGGAFNGLTLVGNVSELTGMMIIVR